MPPAADFNDFFALLTSTALTSSKKTPPTKNVGKHKVLRGFSYFGVCAHVSKIIGKSLRTRSSSESRRRERSKNDFLSFGAPKSSPRSLWGASGGLLGLLWHPPGRQLRPLGALLGAPWELRGRSWALLARSWRRFFAQILETSSAGTDFPRFGFRLGTKTY